MSAFKLSELIVSFDARPWARAVIAALALALIGVTAVWVIHEILIRENWPAYTDMGLYLDAANEIAHGRDPYAGDDLGLHRYPYPPLFAGLIAVLVAIFGSAASYVWITATAVFFVATLWLINRRFGFTAPLHWILLGAGLLLIGRTARIDLMHGQLNFMLMLLLVMGLLSWRAERVRLASVLWAVAICCKPFLGVIVLFLLRQGAWKTALMTFVLSGVIFWASFLPTFPNVFDTFQSWRETTQHYASPAYAANPLNQSFYALGLRLFTVNDFSQPWADAPILAFLVPALAALAAGFVFWITAAPQKHGAAHEAGAYLLLRFGAALAALLSLGPVTEGDHLFFVLPGLFGAMALTWSRVRAQSADQLLWIGVTAAWLLLAAVLAWPRQLLLYFGDEASWAHLKGAGILLSGANAFLLMGAAAPTAIALRRESKEHRVL
ncbi:MAG: DUF2029 domain-containing protein [Phycisphaerales bacterium]|nr:DUF2029 domain-containing protein [Hyphomonadaceae bacterium]